MDCGRFYDCEHASLLHENGKTKRECEHWLNLDRGGASLPPKTTPVMKDDTLENFVFRTSDSNGAYFRCQCGCNVFHKPDDTKLELYQCNACDTQYEGSDD